MKKLIHACFITLALVSTVCNASQSIKSETAPQNETSYACKVMLERGSIMFCGKSDVLNSFPKSASADTASLNKNAHACNVMAGRSSNMFC